VVEPEVSGAAGFRGELVCAIGVDGGEAFGGVEEMVDGTSGGEAIHDAGDGEVRVVDGRVDEHGAGRDDGEDFGEIEWHLFGIAFEAGGDGRHVAWMAPAGEVTVLVMEEGVETATGDDGADTRFECGEEEGVVTAEGMADGADAVGIDIGHGREQVDGAAVIPDGVHGSALVSALVRVGLVIAEVGIIGGEDDVAAFGEFVSVVQVWIA
jgi:hypothetical protein